MLKGGDAGARRFDSTRAPKHIHLRRRRETRDAVAERDRRNRVRVTVCYSLLRMIQAAALATEACNSRMNAVHKQFPPTTFVDKDFQVTPLTLTEPEAFMHSLPSVSIVAYIH